ncbi:hypothetical protein Solca_0833 [Solitalea canadensis DSM 3403]|uniref:DUF4468 domain-containing protein n=2 Tax=Solitalea canadensis TaxID=995 RepID=H8KPQ0_SOLCM|nr:hypothetical protein Solca_0833 [Solitalea canadensis DSM 3403]
MMLPILALAQDDMYFDKLKPKSAKETFPEIRLPFDNGRIAYTGVVIVDSVKMKELFVRAKEWTALTFNSAQDVIQMDDKEAGKLIIKAIDKVNISSKSLGMENITTYSLYFTLNLTFKDNKYKYELNNFRVMLAPSKEIPHPDETLVENTYQSYHKYCCEQKRDYWVNKSMLRLWADILRNVDESAKIIIDELKIAVEKPSNGKNDW